jgi:CRP/FNR family transcriptional regulator, cyclic AMP receptor protein
MDTSSFFSYPTSQVADTGRASGFLELADEREWDILLTAMQTLVLRPGDTPFAQGQTDRALYLLTDGTLEVAADDAAPVTVAAPPAAVLNEIAFLDGGRCTATARSMTDGLVLRLSYDAFESLAAREPQLGRMIVLDLARDVAQRLRRGAGSAAQRDG